MTHVDSITELHIDSMRERVMVEELDHIQMMMIQLNYAKIVWRFIHFLDPYRYVTC